MIGILYKISIYKNTYIFPQTKFTENIIKQTNKPQQIIESLSEFLSFL